MEGSAELVGVEEAISSRQDAKNAKESTILFQPMNDTIPLERRPTCRQDIGFAAHLNAATPRQAREPDVT